jgi:hypothetical protein
MSELVPEQGKINKQVTNSGVQLPKKNDPI